MAFVTDGGRERRPDDPLILLGEGGRVYAVDLREPQKICRVGDTLDGFFKRGLRRWMPIYARIGEFAFSALTPEAEGFFALRDRKDLIRFADEARAKGLVLKMRWPDGDTLAFDCQAAEVVVCPAPRFRDQVRRMVCFATVGPANFGGAARCLLYVDEAGQIFMFDDMAVRLHLVADDVVSFARIGVKEFYKTYTFCADAREWRPRPICPHTSTFHAKVALDAANDLLLSMYRQRMYGRGNFRPQHE